jgi:hypothetical protein
MKLSKTTILDGHYATGDYECFCFDTHSGPEDHLAMQTRAADGEFDDEPYQSCRTYPQELLPVGAEGKGRWTITIEFEPEEP